MKRALLSLALALVLGCSSDDEEGSSSTGGRRFTSDALPSGPVVYLTQKSLNQQLVLEVRGRGVPDAYGVAWRLEYDPAVLDFFQMDPAPGFGAADARVYTASEPRPGLLLAVVSAKGSVASVDAIDDAIASVSFDVVGKSDSRVDFVTGRNGVVTASGKLADVTFVGGELAQ